MLKNTCILPIQFPVEFRVDGILHRFKVGSFYSKGERIGYVFDCISEEPTMRYKDKVIPNEKVAEAVKLGKIKVLYI